MTELMVVESTTKVEHETQMMTSKQICAVTGKRHKNTLQLIRSLIDKGLILAAEFKPRDYKDERGKTYPMYALDKKASLLVVSRQSPEFNAKIIDRWQELENKQVAKPKQITHSSTNTSKLLTDIFGGSEEFLPSVSKSNEDYSSFSSESLSLLVTSEGDLMTNKNLMSKETGVSRKDINKAVADVENSYKQAGIYETNVLTTDKNGKLYTLNAYLLVCERLRQLKCLVGNLASESFLLQADSYYLSDQFKEQLKYSMQLRNINQEMVMVSNQKALGVNSGTVHKDRTETEIEDLTSLLNNKTLKQIKNDFALNEDTPDSVKEELDSYDKLDGRTKEILLHEDDKNIVSDLYNVPTKTIETRTVSGGKRTVKVYDEKIGKNEDGINKDAYFIHSIVPAENESYQETTNRRQELKLYKKIGYYENDNSRYDSIKLDTSWLDRIINKHNIG